VVLGLVYAAIFSLTSLLDLDPHPVLLFLVLGLGGALLGVILIGLRDEGAVWQVEEISPLVQHGRDSRFLAYIRILESHQHAREPDDTLRQRLAVLADRTLRIRHGVSLDDPRAVALLGPTTTSVVSGPTRRLTLSEVDACLTRIEEL
jgi:hypothetical protein